MPSWPRLIAICALCAPIPASPAVAQSASAVPQSGVAMFWNAAKCGGGYQANLYSAHCEPGPAAVILDFNAKAEFYCVNAEAVDISWRIPTRSPTDPEQGSPIPPAEVHWRPRCWKKPLELGADAGATILTPQYSQTPPPNYYMTMNVFFMYDAAKPAVKACLIPLFPDFPVEQACADAEIRP